jgi:hypothetical protein
LILWYPFDGNADNYGLTPGYDGVESNLGYQNGKIAQAVVFAQAANSHVTVNNSRTPLSTDPDYTVGMWFREDFAVHGLNNVYPFIWDNRGATGGFESYHGVSSDLMTTCASGDDGGGISCASFAYGIGNWHHLMYRYDGKGLNPGDGADLEIYLDGSLITTLTNANADVIYSAGQLLNLVLGKNSNWWIDDLKVYNRVFTDQEACEMVIGGSWNVGCILP